jgi:hypothetical protein
VVVAGLIARKLGVEHTVTEPKPPGAWLNAREPASQALLS